MNQTIQSALLYKSSCFYLQAATGRSFGDKDFRGNLENGIFLCELLSCIKPGLVKKINRLPTPIAGLDNLTAFLRGCEELGLKGSQLFDPGDLQDTSTRPTAKGSDCSRRLKNVLITVYWLGRAANSCTSYSGPTLDLKEFEALLSQMQKEAEVTESPSLSIRDSGYIDCWDSERSDSLSPPRHGREDSFDSLDSFGSRSQQTPSPDVLAVRGSSDGRGSDSESDGLPNRKMPDIHKDDMLARRTSVTELRTAMPFNQYLPNKSNQSGYVPLALRKKKNNKEADGGGSWSTTTSPVGGSRPCRSMSMVDMHGEENRLQPHSQVRHERMLSQYNQMKEEESHWQDDLARWKSRRRSISQDLIKKEEERKLMEQLLTGHVDISQRRRSIKTYREIVQDKEQREEELRQAYKQAKTPEEASAILHRYAQRFSVSEAVLERLQLPKLLDCSVSADPSFPISLSASPTTPDPFDEDPDGPLKYLRQHSAPTPKFTSTLEARIEEIPKEPPSQQRLHVRSRSSEPPSTRALSPKAVPLLSPKPYIQFRPAAAETRDSKVRRAGHQQNRFCSLMFKPKENVNCCLFYSSEAKQEQQKTELTSENLSSLIRSEMHTQKNKPKTNKYSCHLPSLLFVVNVCVQLFEWMVVNVCMFMCVSGANQVSVPVFPQAKREDRWSWDPDEERKRQERWQQEQEHMLQVHSLPSRSSMVHECARIASGSQTTEQICPCLTFCLKHISESVSGKKLCSSCTQPLGKGAAMIIETLSLYFHIHCFKCGLCKGQLGDTTTGTDVRIRNGLLNCHQCYMRSRCESPPTFHPLFRFFTPIILPLRVFMLLWKPA
uniref:LIM and calponin homology domains 1b n=1 Tax=Oryzias sinensis TaxID=183150 RepID=A0A8C7WRW3_9TELE